MASRVAPRTANSTSTWPVESGPRWDRDRSIAITRRWAASGDVRLEKATLPQMPHISGTSRGLAVGRPNNRRQGVGPDAPRAATKKRAPRWPFRNEHVRKCGELYLFAIVGGRDGLLR